MACAMRSIPGSGAADRERVVEPMRLMGKLRRPNRERIRALAALEHIAPSEQALADYERVIDEALGMIDTLDTLSQPEIPLKYPNRPAGRRPRPDEDPLNAFITCCDVKGAPEGKLKGRRVGLKDNIRLAGVPMTNGSSLISSFVRSSAAV